MSEKNPMEDWLSMYPPGKKIASEKSKGDREAAKKAAPNIPGVKKIMRQDPEETLDIHGLTKREAEKVLDNFLKNCRKNRIRKILIIHGKGNHSNGQAVLLPLVRKKLGNCSDIIRFGIADSKWGGNGATWAIVR